MTWEARAAERSRGVRSAPHDRLRGPLGFGTASLHHLPSERERWKLLDRAASAGFRHFDTAPLYGFGAAERALRPLLNADTRLTVATKVGLYAPGGSEQSALAMQLRKIAGKLVRSLSKAEVDWSVERARESLTASLQRLGRQRVDALLLHEPNAEILASDEWSRWLEDEIARGRIASFGLAGSPQRLRPFIQAEARRWPILQTEDTVCGGLADDILECASNLIITYGYFRTSPQQCDAKPLDFLRAAVARNANGLVLVSTRKFERIAIFEEFLTKFALGNPEAS